MAAEVTRYALCRDGKYLRHHANFSYAKGREYGWTDKPQHARLYSREQDANSAQKQLGGSVMAVTCTFR